MQRRHKWKHLIYWNRNEGFDWAFEDSLVASSNSLLCDRLFQVFESHLKVFFIYLRSFEISQSNIDMSPREKDLHMNHMILKLLRDQRLSLKTEPVSISVFIIENNFTNEQYQSNEQHNCSLHINIKRALKQFNNLSVRRLSTLLTNRGHHRLNQYRLCLENHLNLFDSSSYSGKLFVESTTT